MKFKTTKKEMEKNFKRIIKIGYCQATRLLAFEKADAYTAGAYGWNADIYLFDGVAIVTGYRPFGNIIPRQETIEEFDTRANELLKSNLSLDACETQLTQLINEFIVKVVKED